MLPSGLSGVAGRREQLAGTEEGWRRASRNIVAEEGQRVDGDGASDRNEGGTNSAFLSVMRRAALDGACTHGPPNSKPWGSSTATALEFFLGAIVVCCERWENARDREMRARW